MTTENTKPGRGYIYVEMTIKDPQGFKDYTALSAPAVQAAGGRYIVCASYRDCRIRPRDQGPRVLSFRRLSGGAREASLGGRFPHDLGGGLAVRTMSG